jgi:protoporphyrinogen IX oxidase
MAGLLYLPRLFVYHCGVSPISEASTTFKIMEFKLYRYIMTPSMVSTWLFGLCLSVVPEIMSSFKGAFNLKVFLVFILSGLHGMMGSYLKAFRDNNNTKTDRFYRILNEIPFVLMALIVYLVVVKPF